MKIIYCSNNSGGTWWLKDKHWKALEKAGWVVHWASDPKSGLSKYLGPDGKYLGALARDAHKDFETPAEAIREFEEVTGLEASDEGCNCCGPPHCFSWEGDFASGEDCLEYLYGKDTPKTLREAIERKLK